MSNGVGTGCYFSSNVTQTAVTGSVLDFSLKKAADKKEITDGTDNYLQVAFTKRTKTINTEIVLQGSGSAIVVPEIGNTLTFASPWTTDVSGSWSVTSAEVKFKNDDFVKLSVEAMQWLNAAGTPLT